MKLRVTFVSFVPWESWEASSGKAYRKKKENDMPFTQLQRQREAMALLLKPQTLAGPCSGTGDLTGAVPKDLPARITKVLSSSDLY